MIDTTYLNQKSKTTTTRTTTTKTDFFNRSTIWDKIIILISELEFLKEDFNFENGPSNYSSGVSASDNPTFLKQFLIAFPMISIHEGWRFHHFNYSGLSLIRTNWPAANFKILSYVSELFLTGWSKKYCPSIITFTSFVSSVGRKYHL